MTERTDIEMVQDGIAMVKKGLRSIQKLNTEAGRDAAANAAMKHRGQAICLHAEMTESLIEFYPEFSSEIQTRGGER